MSHKYRIPAILAVAALGLAACPADETASPTQQPTAQPTASVSPTGPAFEPAAEVAAFCAANAAVDEAIDSPEGPTQEVFDAAVAAAPDEIKAEAGTVAQTFGAQQGNFGAMMVDPAFPAAFNALQTFVAANCSSPGTEADFLIEAFGDTDPAEGAEVVEITTVEFNFNGAPADLTAGSYAFEVTNGGANGHEAFMAKLADGVTLQAVLDFEGDPFAEGLATEEVGFVLVPTPGDTRVINADLSAGTYAMVCFIPGPQGTPHVELGMSAEIEVS